MLLKPGSTCWRVETSPRLGLIIDMEDYFAAAKIAMTRARRSIHLLNWAFDPDTYFLPNEDGRGPPTNTFGPFLRIWPRRTRSWTSASSAGNRPLPVAATQNFFPHRAKKCFQDTPVKFRLDGSCRWARATIRR